MPLIDSSGALGRLIDPGPYRAWVFRTGLAAIQGAHGRNCWTGPGGAVLFVSKASAEEMIRRHGHEPNPAEKEKTHDR